MLAQTISVLLICQSFSTVAAHERLVRKAVSATGEIIDSATEARIAPDAKYSEYVSANGQIIPMHQSSMGIADNGDVYGSAGSLMESQSSEELLAHVEDMLKKTKKNLEDGDQINVIKQLVKEELLPDLQQTHDAAQEQIKRNLAAIDSCNSRSTQLQQSVKSSTEAATSSARTAHANCREEEMNKNETKGDSCRKLDIYLAAISPPADLPSKRPRDSMVDYVETMSSYFCPKGPEVTELDKDCTKAEQEHAAHQADCNTKQATFELNFCTWRTQLTDACGELGTCYASAVKTWQEHVAATNELVKKWKVEFRTLHKIMCYTDVWLSDKDTNTVDSSGYDKCKDHEESATEMEIDAGAAAAKTTCDLSPVETYPGTANFPAKEYSAFAEYATSPIPCPEIVKTVVEQPIAKQAAAETTAAETTAAPKAAAAETTAAPEVTEAPATTTTIATTAGSTSTTTAGSTSAASSSAGSTTTTPAPEEETTTSWVPPKKAIDDGKWSLVHYCTHCGNQGSSWKRGLGDEDACGERCSKMGKPLLIYNHKWDNCRCYDKEMCTEDKRFTSDRPECHYHVYGNGQ